MKIRGVAKLFLYKYSYIADKITSDFIYDFK